METVSSIVFAGIAPHPPIMVPEVGHEAIIQVRSSIEAMAELSERLIASGAETVVLISPHAPLDPSAFVAYQGPTLAGDFGGFRAPRTGVEAVLDEELLQLISQEARSQNFAVIRVRGSQMDHGTTVPLYFLQRYGWHGRVVALGFSFLSNEDHTRFGVCIRRAAEKCGHRVAFVASGDLSHRLKPEAPAGYNPRAHLFDELVVEALRSDAAERIIEIDPDLRKLAGECGYRSLLVALGATQDSPRSCEVLSYEAPFGVGYLVAQLSFVRAEGAPGLAKAVRNEADQNEGLVDSDQLVAALARKAVETFVLTNALIKPPRHPVGLLAERAACFVSIKTRTGDLRGCVGTVEPAQETLAQELILNAIHAASRDPRFQTISAAELPHLSYSVDVLSAPEPATFAELDPKNFGVIVEDDAGRHRGLLLPDLEGVDTAAKQVEIAARKGGIPAGVPVRLSRFRVQRFREV